MENENRVLNEEEETVKPLTDEKVKSFQEQ